MHERRFHRAIERLRDSERVERLEVGRVVRLTLEGPIKPQSALDVGMGSGLFAEAFSAEGLRVAGVDANPEMIPAAKSFLPAGVFKAGIAEALPFNDDEFDLVFMGLVLHETDDRVKALQEAFRVCEKRLAVLEWPYEVQEFGPGMEERIREEEIQRWSEVVGFTSNKGIRLKNLMLYLLDK
jgi:ubiquinone/menaquinone biosynthesis C-methylase UbiE